MVGYGQYHSGMRPMRQTTLATGTFEVYRKTTRREKFLADMEKAVPWPDLCAVIAPHYPKGENGRPPVGLERMLRIDFLQQWFNLSDPGAEEALYESVSTCRFADIDLGREPVPDETTIPKFRHLLEKHHLGRSSFGRFTGIWSPRASGSRTARLWMPRSSARLRRPDRYPQETRPEGP